MAVHVTARNTYMGLAGFYIVHDPAEDSIPIPQGRYDVPLVLRDALFARDGSLIFDTEGQDSLFGHVILVNGRPWPRMRVERRKYLFRILNAATSRGVQHRAQHRRAAHCRRDRQRADAGTPADRQHADRQRGALRSGDRLRPVPDRPQVVLRNRELDNNRDFENTDVIMRFDVVSDATDSSNNQVPPVLNPNDPAMALQESQAVRSRRMEFERGGGEWTINDQTWADVERSGFSGRSRIPASTTWRSGRSRTGRVAGSTPSTSTSSTSRSSTATDARRSPTSAGRRTRPTWARTRRSG